MNNQAIKITRLGAKNSPIKTVGELRKALEVVPDEMLIVDDFVGPLSLQLIFEPYHDLRYVQISGYRQEG